MATRVYEKYGEIGQRVTFNVIPKKVCMVGRNGGKGNFEYVMDVDNHRFIAYLNNPDLSGKEVIVSAIIRGYEEWDGSTHIKNCKISQLYPYRN